MRKLTIKKLTASDLTFFEWHFRNRNAGNQKAINLNKDIFIDKLYPSLPVIAEKSSGKIPLDLTLYGPGVQGEYNLQRKIVKFGAYKNWRLNGEFIYNPEGQPERFNVLEPGDMAILDFQGDIQPVSAKVVLLSNNIPEDKHLVGICNDILKDNKMVDIQLSELRAIVKDISPSAEHPINEILLDEILEDVSFGDFQATEKLLRRHPGKKISRSELQSARQNADSIGQAGEEFVNIEQRWVRKFGQRVKV